jgi:glycosyltransferase involved in cell wall biosynthesis
MKILYCESLKANNLATWSVHVFEVVSNLSRMGHEVVLLNNDPPKFENYIDMRRKSWQDSLKQKIFKTRLIRPFTGYITIIALLFIEVKVFASAFRILMVNKPRFNVIYRRHNLFSSERILSGLFKVPTVREVNGIYSDEIKSQKRGDKLSQWIIDRIERSSMPNADKVVAITVKLKGVLNREYGVPEDKITVIPNGANINLFRPMDTAEVRKGLRLDPGCRYVCFVGNLVKWLNIENLINSAPYILEKLPDTKFLIVGDGELRETLKSRVNELGIADKFIFTGMVPYERVPLYMNAADICVMPATADFRNTRLGMSPLKLHEYMACGKPVIAGKIEGDTQEIAEAGLGALVDTTREKEMAAATIAMLVNEPLRKEMGQRARQIVVDKYSWMKSAEHVAEVCRSAANHNSDFTESTPK